MSAIGPHDYYAGRMLQGLVAAGFPVRPDTIDDLTDRAHRFAAACVARRSGAIRAAEPGADIARIHPIDLYASEALVGLIHAEADRGLEPRRDVSLVCNSLLIGRIMFVKRQALSAESSQPGPRLQQAI